MENTAFLFCLGKSNAFLTILRPEFKNVINYNVFFVPDSKMQQIIVFFVLDSEMHKITLVCFAVD